MNGAAPPAAPAAAEGQARGEGLWRWSLFAAALSAAGLPIYIHAPKVYVDTYGVSLAALGAVLFVLRLVDVVQDPALGWLSARLGRRRGAAVGAGVALMAAAMLGLFAVAPPIAPLAWFALTLALLFSAFSFLTITFYAAGVARAGSLGPGGHVRLAGWREGGALAGVCLAAVAPALLAATGAPFAAFALAFAAAAVLAGLAMRGQWRGAGAAPPARGEIRAGFAAVLADPAARRLLLLALVNAMPLAVTSTLFLFFVESRLAAPGWEGPLLLLFFLAAAVSAPVWSRLAARWGTRRALLRGMALAVISFAVAAALRPGDVALFAAVCLTSGAAVGADLTLLPALFAARLARVAPAGDGAGALGFGLWSFASKLTLALAAAVLLPVLEAGGFRPGAANEAGALALLGTLYAVVPCILKLGAIALLYRADVAEAA